MTNILLLGNDVAGRQGGRTDSIIVLSIDEGAGTATMLSLPRDLYVAIPGWQMARINQALPHGHGSNYPGGGGALVKDTILFNFGIPIDYYVRAGFEGFKQAIDAVNGVEVVVSCRLTDWRLSDPELDPALEESWEMYTLDPGVYFMDGDLALWYARSRRTTSDFERGRRQQQILRALLARGLDRDIIPQLPKLWSIYQDSIETDLTLPVVLRLAALAPQVRDNGLRHLYLPQAARRAWTSPGGGAVQRLVWDGAVPVFAQLMQPPALDSAQREQLVVELAAPSNFLYRLAAENLARHGFIAVRVEGEEPAPSRTQITHYGPNLKGSFHWLISWIFDIPADQVTLAPAPAEGGPAFRVDLSAYYDPCRPELEAPNLSGGSD